MWLLVKDGVRYSGFYIGKRDLNLKYIDSTLGFLIQDFMKKAKEADVFFMYTLDEVKKKIKNSDSRASPVVVYEGNSGKIYTGDIYKDGLYYAGKPLVDVVKHLADD